VHSVCSNGGLYLKQSREILVPVYLRPLMLTRITTSNSQDSRQVFGMMHPTKTDELSLQFDQWLLVLLGNHSFSHTANFDDGKHHSTLLVSAKAVYILKTRASLASVNHLFMYCIVLYCLPCYCKRQLKFCNIHVSMSGSCHILHFLSALSKKIELVVEQVPCLVCFQEVSFCLQILPICKICQITLLFVSVFGNEIVVTSVVQLSMYVCSV